MTLKSTIYGVFHRRIQAVSVEYRRLAAHNICRESPLDCRQVSVDFHFPESRRAFVSFSQFRRTTQGPVDRKIGIIPSDRSLVLWGVEVGGLVSEFCPIREDEVSVREAGRNPKSVLIFRRQALPDPLPECRRGAA